MNSELELITKDNDGNYRCVCGAEFTAGGDVILAAHREEKRKAAKTGQKKTPPQATKTGRNSTS